MSGNNTLSTLLTDVRDMLNEPIAGFWTDAVLTRYLRRAHRKYYHAYNARAPGHNTLTEELTYTGGSRYVAVAADPPMDRIISIEDRTNAQSNAAGPMLRAADSIDELLAAQGSSTSFGDYTGGWPAMYWLENFESNSAGVRSVEQRLWVAPTPTGSRTLLIRYQAEPSDFDSTTDTSGLPEYVENCIVIKAAMLARGQEENPSAMAALAAELREAEHDMRVLSRANRRGPGRIVYRNMD